MCLRYLCCDEGVDYGKVRRILVDKVLKLSLRLGGSGFARVH